MRYFARFLVAVCLCASMIRAQDQPKFSPAQQEVLDAHKARVEAAEKRDYTTYSRLVADDCMYSDDDELDTNPKAHVMEHWKLPLAFIDVIKDIAQLRHLAALYAIRMGGRYEQNAPMRGRFADHDVAGNRTRRS